MVAISDRHHLQRIVPFLVLVAIVSFPLHHLCLTALEFLPHSLGYSSKNQSSNEDQRQHDEEHYVKVIP